MEHVPVAGEGKAAGFVVLIASPAEQAGRQPKHVGSLALLRQGGIPWAVQAAKGRLILNLQADMPQNASLTVPRFKNSWQ